MGVDAGEAVPIDDGYRGAALNLAARLCAKAKAGEILATDHDVHLAGTVKEVGYGLRRQERLKGFDRPVTAVEIVPAGTGSDARCAAGSPPVRAARARARASAASQPLRSSASACSY